MNDTVLTGLIGIVTGTAGYWFTTFWMRPILEFRNVRSRIFVELIFYAQATNPEGMNERLQKLYESRVEANRRSSAELSAVLLSLPSWYKAWLRLKKYKLDRAATDLIGLSNTREHEAAAQRMDRIKEALGIKTDVV